MRERGKKTYALVDGKMVKFAQRRKYEAWFSAMIASRDRVYDESEMFTTDEVFDWLEAESVRCELRSKITRRRK